MAIHVSGSVMQKVHLHAAPAVKAGQASQWRLLKRGRNQCASRGWALRHHKVDKTGTFMGQNKVGQWHDYSDPKRQRGKDDGIAQDCFLKKRWRRPNPNPVLLKLLYL